MKERNNLISELKSKVKKGTAVVAASTMLAVPSMSEAKDYNSNIENPYTAPAYYDIDLPKSVLKSVAEYCHKSAPDINRQDMLNVKDLIVNDEEINNLDFIINFTNLERLTISGIHITNISALRNCKIKSLVINYTSIGNEDLVNLPDSIEELTICDCPLISDCSVLSSVVPNLKLLELNFLPSLKSMNFVKNMKLESLYVNQLGIVDNDILMYLNNNDIYHNITNEDLNYCEKIDSILSSIIDDKMTDEEKIEAVTLYTIKNIVYDLSIKYESNEKPLEYALNGSGVCLSYSYLMSVLLAKLNIESYQVYNDTHAWNLINKDGKYYYIDSTNLTQNYSFLESLFEKFGIGLYYMQDPNSTIFSHMESAKSGKVSLDDELFNKIMRGEADKTILEKYFSNIPLDIIYLAALFTAVNVLKLNRFKKKREKIKEIEY